MGKACSAAALLTIFSALPWEAASAPQRCAGTRRWPTSIGICATRFPPSVRLSAWTGLPTFPRCVAATGDCRSSKPICGQTCGSRRRVFSAMIPPRQSGPRSPKGVAEPGRGGASPRGRSTSPTRSACGPGRCSVTVTACGGRSASMTRSTCCGMCPAARGDCSRGWPAVSQALRSRQRRLRRQVMAGGERGRDGGGAVGSAILSLAGPLFPVSTPD